MKNFTIGVLGGMGTYATVHLFKEYADVFSAEKEWDRPRIIIDNRCTMPSRVRAFLYEENVEQLVSEMSESMDQLVNSGATRIILACNTSHLFLPNIFDKSPQIKDKVISIIETCVNKIHQEKLRSVFLLASEGTIESKIYQNALAEVGIDCIVPSVDDYEKLRECIEAVKQNKYSDEVKNIFVDLMNQYESCILGCTELPILYDMYKNEISTKNVFDPLYLTVLELKKEYDNE